MCWSHLTLLANRSRSTALATLATNPKSIKSFNPVPTLAVKSPSFSRWQRWQRMGQNTLTLPVEVTRFCVYLFLIHPPHLFPQSSVVIWTSWNRTDRTVQIKVMGELMCSPYYGWWINNPVLSLTRADVAYSIRVRGAVNFRASSIMQ